MLKSKKLQILRLLTRSAFFLLYLLTPVFDLFRFDLERHKFILFQQPVDLGIDAFRLHQITPLGMLWNFAELKWKPLILVLYRLQKSKTLPFIAV